MEEDFEELDVGEPMEDDFQEQSEDESDIEATQREQAAIQKRIHNQNSTVNPLHFFFANSRKPMKRKSLSQLNYSTSWYNFFGVFLIQCHKRLEINFGDKINFVIGHNGSGKSAILTALQICLGGKATATNRGASLKHLIKEGRE